MNCGYPDCTEKVHIQKWNHPRYGYMCDQHDEQENIASALERFFEWPMERLESQIESYKQMIHDEECGKTVNGRFVPPRNPPYHMVKVWKKYLRIAEAVYEIRKGEE